jgi:hypothetical protein
MYTVENLCELHGSSRVGYVTRRVDSTAKADFMKPSAPTRETRWVVIRILSGVTRAVRTALVPQDWSSYFNIF